MIEHKNEFTHEWEEKAIKRVQKYATPIAIVALILPLLFFAWQISIHIGQEKSYQPWRIKVEGYDPRHILKGRFIRYRYAFDFAENENSCSLFPQDCCLCLTGNTEKPQARLLECSGSEVRSCEGILKGKKGHRNIPFNFGLREYYVDERAAKVLDKILRSGDILMSVDLMLKPLNDDGMPQITKKARLGELYVNGQALSDMLDGGVLPLDQR